MRCFNIFLSCFLVLAYTLITVTAADCDIYGLSLRVGEKQSVPGKCSEIQCNGKGSTDFVITACPNAYAPPHCKFVPVNLNKPYPDCCPHWDC